jgi:hypothetical protein
MNNCSESVSARGKKNRKNRRIKSSKNRSIKLKRQRRKRF